MKAVKGASKLGALLLISTLIGAATYGAVSAAPKIPQEQEPPPPGDAADGIPNAEVYLPVVQNESGSGGDADQLYVFKVTVNTTEQVQALTSSEYDVLEARGPDYLLVQGDEAVANSLRSQGYAVAVERRLQKVGFASSRFSPMTYFGGYRTVVEQYAHLDAVAAAKPSLVTLVDYGDSWRKVQGLGGNDLRAICITNKQVGDCALNPNSTKPRFLLVAAIHARELSTAEMAYRWIDYLVDNYNVDPDVTALLDHNEMWVVPLVNPDGRQIVEQGGNSPYLQRKNANNSVGNCSNPPTSSNQHGVDLNRNANFKWGGLGSSTSPCTQTYRGVGAASEPEEQALEGLMANLFPDQRGPNDTDVAPNTTTGAMVTLHSYSNYVILPWGFVECNATACPPSQQAPNNTGLRSFAFRMSFFNSYRTGQGSEILYATTGTTDDWAYGVLGIPAFTFELGPTSGTCSGFTPAYSCQDGTFWPINRPAFLYAAKNVRQPYVSTLGPSALSLSLSAGTVQQGTNSTLQAVVNDAQFGNNGFGIPTAQNIAAAEYYIDTPPWAGGTAIPMNAQDGSFNATSEIVNASIDTSGLSVGRHTVFVRGRDSANNWGATTAAWITVTVAGPTPTPGPTLTPTPTPIPPTATPTPTPGAGPIFSDNFETNLGWTVNPAGTDTATAGQWERGDPAGTTSGGTTTQLNTTVSGVNDLVTGRLAGASAGVYDVDGGITTIRSPNITLPSSGTITLSFRYYMAHLNNSSTADYLRVKVVGSTTTTVLEELGAANNDSAAWATASVNISAYAGQTVYLLIEAADASGASLVEAGIDDVLIQ
jgi:hypothetical protein